MCRFEWMGRVLYLLSVLLFACSQSPTEPPIPAELSDSIETTVIPENIIPKIEYAVVKQTILMKDYFSFIDSLANTTFHYSSVLNEYILVNANPWIIDSLRSQDYYHQKAKGFFIYDHSQQIIFHAGDSLMIPDSSTVAYLTYQLQSARIDVNLPEYKLWVIQDKDTLLKCPVRIGRNAEAYLEFYQRDVDLRTPIGEGEIITVRRKPEYIDLNTGEAYVETKRDDGRRTKMPIMPSLQPSINGKFIGTLIHATTNPKSLGKACSHGCVGTSEPDIWSIYYYCPPGTKVRFRYDLEITGHDGKIFHLKDVYHLNKK
jgi:L,D-transpeptidase ErfK/SrfK